MLSNAKYRTAVLIQSLVAFALVSPLASPSGHAETRMEKQAERNAATNESLDLVPLFSTAAGVAHGLTRNAQSLAPWSDARVPGGLLSHRPVAGPLSSSFGMRKDPVKKRRRRMHKGLDFVAGKGTPISAAGPGVVVRAGRAGGYGRMVIIDHGHGVTTRYAHMHRIEVKKGAFVSAGDIIGQVGSSGRVTGPHLHFEVRIGGKAVAPSKVADFELGRCSPRARSCHTASL